MSALTLNGHVVPVADGEWREETVEIGGRARSFSGTLLTHVRARKRRWTGTTPPLTAADAAILRALMDGDGDRWGFEAADGSTFTLYSDKGYLPTTFDVTGVAGKFGLAASVGAGAGMLTLKPGFSAPWSVSVWRFDAGDSAWHHHVVSSDGAKWLDGETSTAGTTWLAVSPSGIAIVDPAGIVVDEVLAVPYLMPTTWPAILAARTTALPRWPRLEAAGDLMPETVTVRAQAGQSETVQGSPDGTLVPLQKIAFVLEEV